jgi:segregation and condensation protein A
VNLNVNPVENTPAQDAIAILIDMAKNGELNPWDVQVIDVIDRCLEKLTQLWGNNPEHREKNLSQSGQAFLYASMLVLLKAETLSQQALQPLEDSSENNDLDGEAIVLEDGTIALPPNLEKRLRRRPTVSPPQTRPVTLQDLIQQLQQMAAAIEAIPERVKTKKPVVQSNSQAAKAIADLAHQENLTEMAGELDAFLIDYWQKMSVSDLDLEQLLELWLGNTEIKENPDVDHNYSVRTNEKVGIFWALLLLSAQSKVELTQDEFYQEINIRAFSDQSISENPIIN